MDQTVIMGLPPPEIDSVVSWRNYGLAHSISSIYLKVSVSVRASLTHEFSSPPSSCYLIVDCNQSIR